MRPAFSTGLDAPPASCPISQGEFLLTRSNALCLYFPFSLCFRQKVCYVLVTRKENSVTLWKRATSALRKSGPIGPGVARSSMVRGEGKPAPTNTTPHPHSVAPQPSCGIATCSCVAPTKGPWVRASAALPHPRKRWGAGANRKPLGYFR